MPTDIPFLKIPQVGWLLEEIFFRKNSGSKFHFTSLKCMLLIPEEFIESIFHVSLKGTQSNQAPSEFHSLDKIEVLLFPRNRQSQNDKRLISSVPTPFLCAPSPMTPTGVGKHGQEWGTSTQPLPVCCTGRNWTPSQNYNGRTQKTQIKVMRYKSRPLKYLGLCLLVSIRGFC